jgi:hypothetical protein
MAFEPGCPVQGREQGEMVRNEGEIERVAREMIARHGPGAARQAIERLNEMIDRNNIPGRDLWACVVHRIHEHQGTGPVWAGSFADSRGGLARLAPQ